MTNGTRTIAPQPSVENEAAAVTAKTGTVTASHKAVLWMFRKISSRRVTGWLMAFSPVFWHSSNRSLCEELTVKIEKLKSSLAVP